MRALRVLRPIRSIEEVQASLDVFGGRIADLLDGRDGASPAAFSYRQVFDDLGRSLEWLHRGVIGAEDEHVRRQVRADALGRQSEELRRRLYDHQVALRRTLGGAWGTRLADELMAAKGPTPRTLKKLEEQVDQTVKTLREPRAEEPEVKLEGVRIDRARVAGGLDEGLRELRATRAARERARKAVGESKVLLDRALAEFQQRFPPIAQVLESFARRVGERELAELVRAASRRVTRRRAASPEERGQMALDPLAPVSGEAPVRPSPVPARELALTPLTPLSGDASVRTPFTPARERGEEEPPPSALRALRPMAPPSRRGRWWRSWPGRRTGRLPPARA